MRKLRVCTPFYADFAPAAPGLASLYGDDRFELVQRQGTIIAHIRNSFVTATQTTLKKQPILDRDFLFVDSDVIFEKDHVEAILRLGEKYPVIFFPYRTHSDPAVYQCGSWGSILGTVGFRYPVTARFNHFVDWCGAGFLYVKKEVFEAIEFPYFRFGVLDVGEHAVPIGEDFGFCLQLSQVKINIYCGFAYPVGHQLRKGDFHG